MRPVIQTGQKWTRKRDGRVVTIMNDLSTRGDGSDWTVRLPTGRRGRMYGSTIHRDYDLTKEATDGQS